MITNTPQPPYYAVIFTSIGTDINQGYSEMADEMEKLVATQNGFLGFESARENIGITVSYWKDLKSIQNWRDNSEHSIARENGRKLWYEYFKVRIAKVGRDYGFEK